MTDPVFIPDHFPTVEAVGSHDLIGRSEFLRQMDFMMRDRKPALLVGPRRIGKSSVAMNVIAGLETSGWKGALIDLRNLPTMQSFISSFFDTTCGLLSPGAGLWEQLRRGGRRIGAGITFKPLGPLVDIGVKLATEDLALADQLNEVLRLPALAARQAKTSVVIALDEFQLAHHLNGLEEALITTLKHHSQNVSWLFLGSQASLLREMFGKERSPLYKAATELIVPDPSSDEWEAYLSRKYSQAGISATPGALVAVVRATGGHPHSTMSVAAQIYQQCVLDKRTIIGLAEVDAAIAQTVAGLKIAYDRDWLDLTRGGHILAQRLALGTEVYGGGLDKAEKQAVKRALTSLTGEGTLIPGKRGEYRMRDALFLDYVGRFRLP